jgi:LL-diaminopimelate aminotransferase
MPFQPSNRVQSLGAYAFAEADRQVRELKAQGVDVIDFGVGDPTDPTPTVVREACKAAVDARAQSGYPSYIGDAGFRRAACEWIKRRFGADIDPDTEICATIGSKEAVFHFGEVALNPGDIALCPTPGYPPAPRGTLFAEGTPYFMPLKEENGFLPDLDAIPADVCAKAKVLWVNYPNNPTGALATAAFYENAIAFARKHDLVLCSDEAYVDLYFGDTAPPSALQFGKEGVLSFFSMSKRSAMTGWRCGFVAGDPEVIAAFKKVKTNIDSGTPTFIQDAAAAGLADETHVAALRDGFRRRKDILVEALTAIGCPKSEPGGTVMLWQRVPEGWTGEEFAARLRQPDLAMVGTPGAWITETAADGSNPSAAFIRFALVPSDEQCQEAARRLVEWGGKKD